MHRVAQAAQFATTAHSGQKRKYSNQPYITHPARVAARTTLIRVVDPDVHEDMIITAWLHDVVEDTRFRTKDIEMMFGERVATWVDKLTNESKKKGLKKMGVNRAERKRVDREALIQAAPEIKIIKIIDRTDNLLEMEGAPKGFKSKYHNESYELYQALCRDESPGVHEDYAALWSELALEFNDALRELI